MIRSGVLELHQQPAHARRLTFGVRRQRRRRRRNLLASLYERVHLWIATRVAIETCVALSGRGPCLVEKSDWQGGAHAAHRAPRAICCTRFALLHVLCLRRPAMRTHTSVRAYHNVPYDGLAALVGSRG